MNSLPGEGFEMVGAAIIVQSLQLLMAFAVTSSSQPAGNASVFGAMDSFRRIQTLRATMTPVAMSCAMAADQCIARSL